MEELIANILLKELKEELTTLLIDIKEFDELVEEAAKKGIAIEYQLELLKELSKEEREVENER